MLAAMQRQLIYFPEVAPEKALLQIAAANGMQDWRGAGGEIIGWRTPPTGDNTRRVVVYHGNAGHALYRRYFVDGFLSRREPWQVFLFEYPGYGARPGSPSEKDIKAAAREAVQALLSENPSPLFLVGESLGSGVASYLAGTLPEQIRGLLLVTPFTSLADVAAGHYSFLPVRTLLSERYDSMQALGTYRGPVAFLIAGNDEIVPAALGRELYESYTGPKWLREQPDAGHNSLDFDPAAQWWTDALAFLTTTAGAP